MLRLQDGGAALKLDVLVDGAAKAVHLADGVEDAAARGPRLGTRNVADESAREAAEAACVGSYSYFAAW